MAHIVRKTSLNDRQSGFISGVTGVCNTVVAEIITDRHGSAYVVHGDAAWMIPDDLSLIVTEIAVTAPRAIVVEAYDRMNILTLSNDAPTGDPILMAAIARLSAADVRSHCSIQGRVPHDPSAVSNGFA